MPRAIVKAPSLAADKWERRASSASEEYKLGVTTTSADWEAASRAAEGAYRTGVTEAANAGRYGQGIQRAGNGKWRENAATLGPGRFSTGVAQAKGAYAAAIGPVLAAIAAVELPARGATGAESNFQRSMLIGKALRQLRVGGRR